MSFADELKQVVEEARTEYAKFSTGWDDLLAATIAPLFKDAAQILEGRYHEKNECAVLTVGNDELSIGPVKDGPWPHILCKSSIRHEDPSEFDIDALHAEIIKKKLFKFARALQCPECRSKRRSAGLY